MKITFKSQILVVLMMFINITFCQTINHVIISGTKCSILPPKDFLVSTSFSGLQNIEKGASIMINELPTSYQYMSDNITADALKAKGMMLISKKIIEFNNSKATFFVVRQEENGVKYLKQLLIFGDETVTVMVNGIYPEKNKSIAEEIMNSILSVSYNVNQNDNPLATIGFEIDVSDTDFKFTKYFSGTILYTIDGKIPTDKPVLMVGNSLSKVTPKDYKQYSIERLKKMPNGENTILKSVNSITIDNIEGYEIVATNKNENLQEEIIYQVMLYTDNSDYYMIVGIASEDKDENLKLFKDIAKTFHVK